MVKSMWNRKAFSENDFPDILRMTQEQYGPENDISNQALDVYKRQGI